MRRHFQVAATTIIMCAAAAVTASAQERDTEPERRRTPDRTFTYRLGPESHIVMRRGRLGVTVDLRPEAGRDTLGALVSGVTPGGPADRAGVQAGDLITRLNGARLVGAEVRSEGDGEQSRPGLKLIELSSRLEPGDTVRLDLMRDNRPQTVTFTAAETDMDLLVERMRIPGGGQGMMREFGTPYQGWMESMPRMRISMTDARGLGDLEMIRVSPELAQALGIAEGVLVADAGSDTTLGLRTGDVITSIGARRPTSPAHAMRILSSYEAGENVQFEVMRRGRRTNVTGRLPQQRQPWRIEPNRFDFDDFNGFERFKLEMEPQLRQHMDHLPNRLKHLIERGMEVRARV